MKWRPLWQSSTNITNFVVMLLYLAGIQIKKIVNLRNIFELFIILLVCFWKLCMVTKSYLDYCKLKWYIYNAIVQFLSILCYIFRNHLLILNPQYHILKEKLQPKADINLENP